MITFHDNINDMLGESQSSVDRGFVMTRDFEIEEKKKL
jgi:hypothetical protein